MINRHRFLLAAGFTGVFASFIAIAPADHHDEGMMRLVHELDESRGICFDITGFRDSIDLDVPIQVHTCKPNPQAREDEVFLMNHPQPGNIYNKTYDVCIDAVAVVERGSVFVRPCSDADTQKFDLTDDGELRPVGESGLCIAVSPSPSHPAIRSGRTPEPGVTFVARAVSFAACDGVDDSLKHWNFSAGATAE